MIAVRAPDEIIFLSHVFHLMSCVEGRYTGHYKIYQQVRIAKVKASLKELETSNINAWNSLHSEDPFQRTAQPFRDFYNFAFLSLKGEYQLWSAVLSRTGEESLQAFTSICDSVVGEVNRVLAPFLVDETARVRQGINPVIRQSKLLLIRLDIYDIVSERYNDFRSARLGSS